ncbi:uncharacterized protein [Haliaeetus albicilla]|uniref:uncharacterized protein n=1 Tax=Haliaeetus albicilla TaxID=8969 RepID=UPI0037E746CE
MSPFHGFLMKATAVCHPLKLTWLTDKPVWVEQWPMTEEKWAAVVELVQREVQMGHLEPSTSPWNTPVFVIKKKSGAWRLLHDLRAVNACLEDMGALQLGLPSPAIVPKGQGVIMIDIKDCFFSIPLHPGDRERFAFSIPEWNHQAPMQRYQWKVLPQGMKNSPTLCQIAVSVLQGALAEFAGTIAGHEVHPCGEILHDLPILPAQQVAKHPNDGRTIFTDASSKTSKAVCVWREDGVWHQVVYTEPSRSVQFLEAKAVTMALLRWPTEPLNVVMDSLYLYKLLVAGEWALASSTEIAGMLLNALQLRSAPIFPIHVTSHSGLPGPLAEGNSHADQAAQALLAVVGDDNITPARARAITLHRLLHCGP